MKTFYEEQLESKVESMKRAGLLGCAFVSVVASVVCAYNTIKTHHLVTSAVNDISDNTVSCIQQSVVDKAVANAADRCVAKAVEDAKANVIQKLDKQVREAVKNSEGEFTRAVAERFTEELGKIDKSTVEQEILRQSKVAIREKVEEKVEEAMESRGGRMGTLYSLLFDD